MKICIATGSRADFGYLSKLMHLLEKQEEFDVFNVVTGSHLSSTHGSTVSEIEEQGIKIHHRIPLQLEDNSPAGIATAFNEAAQGFSDYFKKWNFDLLLVIGDRYEILAAAQMALFHRLPVVHLGGGDVTEGSIDDTIRHCISKIASLHFVSNESSKDRLIRMGESPDTVFNTGSTSMDSIDDVPTMGRDELFKKIALPSSKLNLLVTFHPETASEVSSEQQIAPLIEALGQLTEATILITRPNVDSGSKEIGDLLDTFAHGKPNVAIVNSLGRTLYLNAARHFDVIVGNSSSGIYEAPYLKKAAVNIGTRQKGRPLANSVFQTDNNAPSILAAIHKAQAFKGDTAISLFGNGTASEKILQTLLKIKDTKSLKIKKFHDKEPS